MNIDTVGIELIKKFEGKYNKAYKLQGENFYTIGYGHSFDNSINENTIWSDEQCERALFEDLQPFVQNVNDLVVRKYPHINQNQFNALVSYTYNRGKGGLIQLVNNSSTLKIMSDNIVKYWGSAIIYKHGLINRRRMERALFNTIPQKRQANELKEGTWVQITSYYNSRKKTTNPIFSRRYGQITKIYPNDKNPYQLSNFNGKKFGYCNYGDILY